MSSAVQLITPLSPRFGAVIQGVNRKDSLSPATVDSILEAIWKYKVLVFRGQELAEEEQRAFAQHFGELLVEPLTRNIDGQPGMTKVSNVPYFHSDHMHMIDPPKLSMLQLKVIPDSGGDTMFADLVSAYESLSDAMQGFLESLTVLQVSRDSSVDIRRFYEDFFDEEIPDERLAAIKTALEPHYHPLVRWIPETGRKNAWVCQRFSRDIRELSQSESDTILRHLFAHQLQPQFVLRWRWSSGDLVFWDHRTTLHSAVADFGDRPRWGQRASIAGGRPIPVPHRPPKG